MEPLPRTHSFIPGCGFEGSILQPSCLTNTGRSEQVPANWTIRQSPSTQVGFILEHTEFLLGDGPWANKFTALAPELPGMSNTGLTEVWSYWIVP